MQMQYQTQGFPSSASGPQDTDSTTAVPRCRQKGDVKTARKHLAAVFEAAAFCVGGKLLEAAVMMEERDFGGVVALTGQACS